MEPNGNSIVALVEGQFLVSLQQKELLPQAW